MPGLALRDRYGSFLRLLGDTKEFIGQMPAYSKRDGAAILYAFNSLFDISWKLMKDSLSEFYGLSEIKPSPRDIIKQAGSVGLIDDQELWLAMLRNRNLSTHDYMSTDHEHYCRLIEDEYVPLMVKLRETVAAQLREMEEEEG